MNEFFGQGYPVPFLCNCESSSNLTTQFNLPVGQVGICEWLRMPVNVRRGGIPLRIARHDLVVLGLVYTNVVNSHDSRQIFGNLGKINGSETVRHAEIGDDGHGLFWNNASANIAVGSSRRGLESPGLVLANVPGDEAGFACLVLERVRLVLLAIVPVRIQVGQT